MERRAGTTNRGAKIGILSVSAALVAMWVVEIMNLVFFGGGLYVYGILPRSVDGLDGVVLAPFLHASIVHLAYNTIPFVVFGFLGGAFSAYLSLLKNSVSDRLAVPKPVSTHPKYRFHGRIVGQRRRSGFCQQAETFSEPRPFRRLVRFSNHVTERLREPARPGMRRLRRRVYSVLPDGPRGPSKEASR